MFEFIGKIRANLAVHKGEHLKGPIICPNNPLHLPNPASIPHKKPALHSLPVADPRLSQRPIPLKVRPLPERLQGLGQGLVG